MNNTKEEASINVNAKNIQALIQTVQVLKTKIHSLEDSNQRLANALQNIQADLFNTKQLIAHVMGRGMGTTAR